LRMLTPTVPTLHTIRTASGSFFYIAMSNKPTYSIADQISLLKQRGMLFREESNAPHFAYLLLLI
jgi:hypothetical protein